MEKCCVYYCECNRGPKVKSAFDYTWLKLASYPGRVGGERQPGIDCLPMRAIIPRKTWESVSVWKLSVKSIRIRQILYKYHHSTKLYRKISRVCCCLYCYKCAARVTMLTATSDIFSGIAWYYGDTVGPPITDPPTSAKPQYKGHWLCHRLKLL